MLLKNKAVKEAVVIDRTGEDDNKFLCAFITGQEELTTAEIREYLSKELPDYMIPAYFTKTTANAFNREWKN